jgi:hypothetical protein
MDGCRHVFSMAMVFGYVSPVSYGLIPTWHLQRELYKVLRAVCNYHGSGCAGRRAAAPLRVHCLVLTSERKPYRPLQGVLSMKQARKTQQCMDYNTVKQNYNLLLPKPTQTKEPSWAIPSIPTPRRSRRRGEERKTLRRRDSLRRRGSTT